EAAALEALAAIDPEPLPRLLDVDPEACALTTELAPDGWRAWKDLLLDGEVDVEVARRLGAVLASWQRAPVPPGFDDVETFVQLHPPAPEADPPPGRRSGAARLRARLPRRGRPARRARRAGPRRLPHARARAREVARRVPGRARSHRRERARRELAARPARHA